MCFEARGPVFWGGTYPTPPPPTDVQSTTAYGDSLP